MINYRNNFILRRMDCSPCDGDPFSSRFHFFRVSLYSRKTDRAHSLYSEREVEFKIRRFIREIYVAESKTNLKYRSRVSEKKKLSRWKMHVSISSMMQFKSAPLQSKFLPQLK